MISNGNNTGGLFYTVYFSDRKPAESEIPEGNQDRGLTLDRVENPARRPYKAH